MASQPYEGLVVRETAKRRVDASETIYKDWEIFCRKHKRTEEEPTEKKIKRDMNALLHGKRDGKIVIKNVKPKVTGGKHKVIDEQLTDSGQYKETVEGAVNS
jgi:hypothetical protein